MSPSKAAPLKVTQIMLPHLVQSMVTVLSVWMEDRRVRNINNATIVIIIKRGGSESRKFRDEDYRVIEVS